MDNYIIIISLFFFLDRDTGVGMGTGYGLGGPGIESLDIFPDVRTVLGANHRIQWIPVQSRGYGGGGMMLITHLHQAPRLKKK